MPQLSCGQPWEIFEIGIEMDSEKPAHVLFYSNYCIHCRSIMSDLVKYGLRERFKLVCVDHNRVALPPAINRVPTILDLTNNKLCADDEAFVLVEELSRKDVSSVSAYHGQQIGFSEGFSFLGADEGTFSAHYAAKDEQVVTQMSQNDDSMHSSKRQGDCGEALEKLRAQRSRDMSIIHSSFPRPVG